MNTSSLPSVFQSTLLYHYLSYFKTRNFKTQLAYFFFLKRVGRGVKRNRPISLWLKSGERGRRSLFLTGGERGKGAIKLFPPGGSGGRALIKIFPHGRAAGRRGAIKLVAQHLCDKVVYCYRSELSIKSLTLNHYLFIII